MTIESIKVHKKTTGLKERKIYSSDDGSRVNDLDWFYMLNDISFRSDISMDMGLKKVVELIPSYWQYPEIACSRVFFNSSEYRTNNFKETRWKQSADIVIDREKFGVLETYYLEKRPEAYEGPFLKKERDLINGIAEIVGGFIKQKKTDEALTHSEENYHSLFTRVPFYAFVTDIKGNMLDANSILLKRLGMNLEEIKNTSIRDYLTGDKMVEIQDSMKKLAAGKKVKRFAIQARTPGGEFFEIEVSSVLITGKDNNPNILNISRDITKQKKTEEELKVTLMELEGIFNTSADGMRVIDTKFNVLRVNEQFYKMAKVTREESLKRKCYEVFPGANCKTPNCSLIKILNGSQRIERKEEKIINGNGNKVTYLITSMPLNGPTGKIIGMVSNFKNEMKAQKAEQEIKSLSKFPSENPNPVLRIDHKGQMLYSNQACKKKLKNLGSFKEKFAPRQILDLISDTLKERSERSSIIDISFGKKEYKFFITPIKEAGYINIYGIDITVQKKAERKLKESYLRVKKTLNDTINALSRIVESRDPYTSGHQKRVAKLAIAISDELGLDSDMIDAIGMAGQIHDIGKIAIPASILSKPGKISRIEHDIVKTHSQVGYDMLKDIKFPKPIAKIVLQHHERLDGSGYPKGITGKTILFEAKILAVADVVEAVSSHRPYRPALGIDKALKIISIDRGRLFDPGVVDACKAVFKNKDFSLEKI